MFICIYFFESAFIIKLSVCSLLDKFIFASLSFTSVVFDDHAIRNPYGAYIKLSQKKHCILHVMHVADVLHHMRHIDCAFKIKKS